MLTIDYTKTKLECDIPFPDIYFDNTYDMEWFSDPFVKNIIKEVDNSVLQDNGTVVSPILGNIPVESISGGSKALILMYKTDKVVNASQCGDNCANVILDIAKRKDLKIRLGHLMKFASAAYNPPVYLEEINVYCSNWRELLLNSVKCDLFN